MNFFSVLLIVMIYLVEKSFGKILFDQINGNLNWIYITRFSFHPIDGHIDIRLEYAQSRGYGMKFFVLSKEEWKNDGATRCVKKKLVLNQGGNETNVWTLSTEFTDSNQMYLILSPCNSSVNALNVKYRVVLTNGRNLFTEHFSNDERGILGVFIASTSIYTIIFLIILGWIHLSQNKLCFVIKLYLISIFCSWLNSLINLIFTLIFALTGNNETVLCRLLIFFARLVDFIAQIFFLLMLILCVKGYCIIRIQLRRKTMIKIQLFMLFYILMQIIILILMTIATNQVIPNENLLLACDYMQIFMYFLSCFWFIVSLLSPNESSNKELRYFLIFLIWFITNAMIILLNILNVLPTPQITIIKAIQIGIQSLAYCIFPFIIRSKKFFLRTKLNQINITYIDPTAPKLPMKESSTSERETDAKSNELTDLCYIENTWASRFRIPMKSLGPPPRLEPRRDVFSTTLTKSSVNRHQPSNCHVPRRLPSINHDDQ